MYHRLCKPIKSNSYFLFGSRGTGKSSLLKELFNEDKSTIWLDLLDEDLARRLLLKPKLLEEYCQKLNKNSWVVIDEIQKVPALLDTVHRLIEKKQLRFALTGSSARKLKRGEANLLAGRAFLNNLHPLTYKELANDFLLDDVLQWGSLPQVFKYKTELEKREYLRTYVNTYLKEEIKEEQLVRRIDPFLKFLEVAAQSNGQILNFSKIGRDSDTDYKSVERYYEILIDTLVGFYLDPYHESVRKRQSSKSKFYFFDLGVKKALEQTLSIPTQPRTYAYGNAFEHFFILEAIRFRDYFRVEEKLSYLRTKDDLEIDLIVERPGQKKILIEIKSTDRVDDTEILKLKNIKKDMGKCEFWVVCQEERSRTIEGFEVINWREALNRLYI